MGALTDAHSIEEGHKLAAKVLHLEQKTEYTIAELREQILREQILREQILGERSKASASPLSP